MRFRSFRSLGLVVAVAAFSTGCGATRNPLQTSLAAVTRTLGQSASSTLTLAGATAIGAFHARADGVGAFAFTSGIGYERIDVPVGGGRVGSVFLVFLPGRIYLQPLTRSSTSLPQGKTWVSASVTGPGSPPTRFPRFVEQAESFNPVVPLEEIVWGAESATNLGERVINHVPLAEYRVTVSLRRVLSRATGPLAPVVRATVVREIAALRAARFADGTISAPITVWVDLSGTRRPGTG